MSSNHDFEPDAKALSGLLSSRPLSRLMKSAKHQQILEQLIEAVIPQSIRDNITSCQVEQQQMVIAVSSASWATRLRAHSNDLLYAADRGRNLGKLTSVKIILRPPKQKKRTAKKKQLPPARSPAEQSIEMVQEAANNCEHEELKCALGRLAAHMQMYTDKNEK